MPGSPSRAVALLLAAVCFAAVAACHEYRPSPAAALAPQDEIVVRLDPPRALLVRSDTVVESVPRVSELRGRLIAQRGDSLEVLVRGIRAEAPRPIAEGTVAIVALDTAAIRKRRFAADRTALAVLGTLAAAVGALFIACGEYCR